MDLQQPPLSDIFETLGTEGPRPDHRHRRLHRAARRAAEPPRHPQGAAGPGGDRGHRPGAVGDRVTKRLDTLDRLGGAVIRFFVIAIAGLMILTTVGIDIGPAIAGLGVVGIAVGFGAQSLVRDYLNGCLILIENQFSRGDVVSVAGVTGTVEDFSLRRTTLRDLDGVVHTVPNGEIKVASNRTRTWARINQNVVVLFGTDSTRRSTS